MPAGVTSGDGVEQLLLVLSQVIQRFPDDVAGDDAALATLAGYAKGIVDLSQGTGAIRHGGAYLGVGDSLAEANVHGECPGD